MMLELFFSVRLPGVGALLLAYGCFFFHSDTIMDILNCPDARRSILAYYQKSGEPQAVQEAIMTSLRKQTNTNKRKRRFRKNR